MRRHSVQSVDLFLLMMDSNFGPRRGNDIFNLKVIFLIIRRIAKLEWKKRKKLYTVGFLLLFMYILSTYRYKTEDNLHLFADINGLYVDKPLQESEIVPVWWCYGHTSFRERFEEHNIKVCCV